MKTENRILKINKVDLDHILGYLEFDIVEREKYMNSTGKKVDDFVLSENFLNGLNIELSLNGIMTNSFKEIRIII